MCRTIHILYPPLNLQCYHCLEGVPNKPGLCRIVDNFKGEKHGWNLHWRRQCCKIDLRYGRKVKLHGRNLWSSGLMVLVNTSVRRMRRAVLGEWWKRFGTVIKHRCLIKTYVESAFGVSPHRPLTHLPLLAIYYVWSIMFPFRCSLCGITEGWSRYIGYWVHEPRLLYRP